MDELFNNLESNNTLVVEESKKELTKTFSQTKESWLVYGMMEYFNNTNSGRIVDILVKVPVPHDNYIFDKLLDWINSSKRSQAFILFWHIVKKNPSWLYKVANHSLFREILKVVKMERNVNTSMNALFCIIILLPIIPTYMTEYLPDLFAIFMNLANWKAKNNPDLSGDQSIHLLIGIEILFQRLYGMYPCNFVSFLRDNIKDNNIAFVSVIDPLFKTIKLHPMLLTSNRESEKSSSRWKEMEPHDVVVECEKFALENWVKVPECDQEQGEHILCNQQIRDTPSHAHLTDRFKNIFAPISAMELTKQRVKTSQKLDNIWSPSIAVLATPPPTNALTHTPTPTLINQSYNIQTASSGQYTSSGASPPEAAVEATPETTPMKDFGKPHRPFPVNSSAARTIWINTSQPSSPLKKDDGTSFKYTENTASSIMSNEKFLKLVNDRNAAKRFVEKPSAASEYSDIVIQDPLSTNINDVNVDSSQEDEEVTEINKCKMEKLNHESPNLKNGDSKNHHSDTLKDTRSRLNLVKCHQMKNVEDNNFNDSNNIVSNIKFSSSWPGFQTHVALSDSQNNNANDKDLVEIKENECCSVETQTDKLPLYKRIATELLSEEANRKKSSASGAAVDTLPMSPHTLLDTYIEMSIKRQTTADPHSRTAAELQLLYLQLQYERYRREVHAERNRRLLGKSRDNETLKMDNDKLKYQMEKLSKDLITMTDNLNKAKITQNIKEHELSSECNRLRDEIQIERETNKKLQLKIESLDRRLGEETEEKKRIASSLETTQAEIFDLKNLLQQCQYQAEIGTKYKEELQRLQTREVLMGELQMKFSEKLIELANLRARDGEIASMRQAYNEEVKELRSTSEMRSSQLKTEKEKVQSLEQQLARRDSLVADQKRIVKIVKEEYEEKLKAVEAKYAAQKAIILRLEETILDPYKHKLAVNPEPDKSIDTVGSLDHTSPLSMSLASSEGLSWSRKSVTEIKNLSQLLDSNNSTSTILFSPSSLNGVSASPNSRPVVSDDIPVPSTSHTHYHP